MLEEVKAAYKEYHEKYNRKPDYIVVNHQVFNDTVRECFEDSDPVFMGMHPLVISDENLGFHLYEKWELDCVLAAYEKNHPRMEPYSVLRLNPIKIRRVNPHSNEKLVPQNAGKMIDIDYKTIRAYQRHIETTKKAQSNSN